MICVRGCLSVSSTTRKSITGNTGKRLSRLLCARLLVFTSANSSIQCVYIYTVCVCIPDYVWLFLFIFLHACSFFSPLPPASVSERDLRTSPGPQGSCLDWISNQCYTSCVLVSAIFNTQGETLPGGKGKLSACVGSWMGDIIIRKMVKQTWLEEEGWRSKSVVQFQSYQRLMRWGERVEFMKISDQLQYEQV